MRICKVVYLCIKFLKVTLTTKIALAKGTRHSADLMVFRGAVYQEIFYLW